jgi:hypothetical protein
MNIPLLDVNLKEIFVGDKVELLPNDFHNQGFLKADRPNELKLGVYTVKEIAYGRQLRGGARSRFRYDVNKELEDNPLYVSFEEIDGRWFPYFLKKVDT